MPLPETSVVTSPAVPLPTASTAAACACEAADPVTGFSSASGSAVPWAGYVARGCSVVVVLLEDVEESLLLGVLVVAALALSVPARMPPVMAPAASSPAAPTHLAVRPRDVAGPRRGGPTGHDGWTGEAWAAVRSRDRTWPGRHCPLSSHNRRGRGPTPGVPGGTFGPR